MLLPKNVEAAIIIEQKDLAKGVKEIILYAPHIASQAVAGQFVHIRVMVKSHDPLLRRPISIAGVNREKGYIKLIYRIVGNGTKIMADWKPQDKVDCMGPLGTGFQLQGDKVLLVGGGMGLAPLMFLAESLCPRAIEIVMGGRTKEELFWRGSYEVICNNLHITTDDGTLGTRGIALDVLPTLLENEKYDMIYTCGPKIMMEKVFRLAQEFSIPCQVSLEEHMACGVGACLSCTCQTNGGKRKKICTDGPVFWGSEVFGCK